MTASALFAHGDEAHDVAASSLRWLSEPFAACFLFVTALLYFSGLWHLQHITPKAVPKLEIVYFVLGWIVLVVALLSPLHPLGEQLFFAHMIQHELLMIVAAPLWVLARPLPVFLSALPQQWSGTLARSANQNPWRSIWSLLVYPFNAWLIHLVVLWMWHLPILFDAATKNEWIHFLQHAGFLGSALLFWWAIIHGRQHAVNFGLAVLYLFTTALHSGVLGALITFSRTLWYPIYSERSAAWGLTPLEDQELGGLIMWVPAGLVYIGAGLALFAGWLREAERRSKAIRRTAATTPR